MGSGGLLFAKWKPEEAAEDMLQRFVLLGLPYIIGTITFIVAIVLSGIRIRCPVCQSRLQGTWKKWKCCPYCGMDLDVELELDNTIPRS
jgi:hypothetical protein